MGTDHTANLVIGIAVTDSDFTDLRFLDAVGLDRELLEEIYEAMADSRPCAALARDATELKGQLRVFNVKPDTHVLGKRLVEETGSTRHNEAHEVADPGALLIAINRALTALSEIPLPPARAVRVHLYIDTF